MDLPWTYEEIRRKYREGVEAGILAELNACEVDVINEIVIGVEQKKINVYKHGVYISRDIPKDWKEKAIPLLGKKTDTEIALKVGVSQATVTTLRISLGIPKLEKKKTWR